jgi:hypothetical protein
MRTLFVCVLYKLKLMTQETENQPRRRSLFNRGKRGTHSASKAQYPSTIEGDQARQYTDFECAILQNDLQ